MGPRSLAFPLILLHTLSSICTASLAHASLDEHQAVLMEGSFCDVVDGAGFGASVALGDLDGDGFDDLAVVSQGPDYLQSTIHLYYGNFRGDVQYAGAMGSMVWSVAIADLDHDGHDDVITGGYGNIGVYYGGSGSDRLPTAFSSYPNWEAILYSGSSVSVTAAGDLDGDGNEDVVATLFGQTHVVYGFDRSIANSLRGPVLVQRDVYDRARGRAGDVNGDGLEDLLRAAGPIPNITPKVRLTLGRDDRRAWTWGRNDHGQLGDDTAFDRPNPAQIATSVDWKTISAGASHVMAIRDDGSLWAWGSNQSGQLGEGTTTDRPTPTRVGDLDDWVAVSAGVAHSAGIRADGSLWTWGANGNGQLGDGSTTPNPSPTWVNPGEQWRQVAAAYHFTLAIRADGTLWSWGRNSNGQLGDDSTNDRAYPDQVGSSNRWVHVDGGAYHAAGVQADGSLWTWGANSLYEIGDGTTTERLTPKHIVDPTQPDTYVRVDAGLQSHYTMAIRSDQSLWTWGTGIDANVRPTKVDSAADWHDVSAGYLHVLARKTDGTLWAWGNNGFGQLGDGTTTPRSTPIPIGDMRDGLAIAAGAYFSVALRNPDHVEWEVAGGAGLTSEYFGEGFGGAGDLNADGYADLYVTDPWYAGYLGPGPFWWGRVHLWYGGPSTAERLAGLPDDATPSMSDILLTGDEDSGTWRAVAIGDLDGDGESDVAIGDAIATRPCQLAQGGLGSVGSGRVLVYKEPKTYTTWVDATTSPLVDTNSTQAVTWADYDGDGDDDLYIINAAAPNRLFRNDGGSIFTEATPSGLGDTASSHGVAWADVDDDGDLDLAMAMDGLPNRLLRNHGSGVFVDIATGPVADAGPARTVNWADYDADGRLDLFVGNWFAGDLLLHNDNGVSFTDLTMNALGWWATQPRSTWNAAWTDYDGDGRPDLWAGYGDDYVAGSLYHNTGSGTFAEATPPGNGSVTASAWGDYDGDLDLDLYLVRDGAANELWRNDGGILVNVTRAPLADPGAGRDASWVDFDHDGDLDLFVVIYGSASRLLRNDGSAGFTDVTNGALLDTGTSTSAAWADYDGDGDLDVYLGKDGQANRLVRNVLVGEHHWIHFHLQGGTSNRNGIGARVELTSGGRTQLRWVTASNGRFSQDSLPVEFGLATSTSIDSVVVRWPSGIRQVVRGLAIDQVHTLIEPAPEFSRTSLGGLPSGQSVWGDFDGDGDLDLLVTGFASNGYLYRNDGVAGFVEDGARFGGASQQAAAWGDYDRDGDLDVLLVSYTAGYLYRNERIGGSAPTAVTKDVASTDFSLVTPPALENVGLTCHVSWVDVDQDGDLDLYLANDGPDQLFRNDGATVFTEAASAFAIADSAHTTWSAWADYDDDGDPDLYLVHRYAPNRLLRNDGTDGFTDVTSAPLAIDAAGVQATWADVDGDGDLDLYVVNEFAPNVLLRNDGNGSFTDITTGPLADDDSAAGCVWLDHDQDGDLDLYLVRSQMPPARPNKLLRNLGGGVFDEHPEFVVQLPGYNRGTAATDTDGDGDVDLLVTHYDSMGMGLDAVTLLRNERPHLHHWLGVSLVGTLSNRDAVGARVVATVNGRTLRREIGMGGSYGTQDDPVLWLGLGTSAVVERLQVVWPRRLDRGQYHTTVLTNVATDRIVTIVEPDDAETDASPAPVVTALHPAHPNPFNPRTTIRYDLAFVGPVQLRIFDARGQLVRRLVVDPSREAGHHEIEWDGRDDRGREVASGVYYCRMIATGADLTRKTVLLR